MQLCIVKTSLALLSLSYYHPLFGSLQKSYSKVKFSNLSMSALGIFGTSAESLLSMLIDLHFDEKNYAKCATENNEHSS